MKDNTVFLLYNTNASGIKLQPLQNNKQDLLWEYVDKDEFTITYGPEDERKYTDIRILSKTKLKGRPRSADMFVKQRKANIEGVFVRRSSSFSSIEDLFLMRRTPLIKPLLSETEIARLQVLQEQCRKKRAEERPSTREGEQMVLETPSEEQDILEEKQQPLYMASRPNGSPHPDFKSKRKFNAVQPDLEKNSRGDIDRKKNIDFDHKTERSKRTKPTKTIFSIGQTETITKQQKKEKQRGNRANNHVDKDKTKSKKSSEKKTKTLDKETKAAPKLGAKKPTSDVEKKNDKYLKKGKDISQSKEVIKISPKNEVKKASAKKLNAPNQRAELGSVEEQQQTLKSDKSVKTNSRSVKEESSNKTNKTSLKQTAEKNKARSREGNMENIKDKSGSGKTPTDNEASQGKGSEKTVSEGKNKTKRQREASGSKRASADHRSPPTPGPSSASRGKVESQPAKSESGQPESMDRSSPKTDQIKSNKPLKKGLQATKSSASQKSSVQVTTSQAKGKKGDGIYRRSKIRSSLLQYVIHYVLSDRVFLERGWTLWPQDPALTRVVTFNTRPAHPSTYCFRNRDEIETKYYLSGSKAVEIGLDGCGEVLYPNGSRAVLLHKSSRGMRLTFYSDEFSSDRNGARVVGMFDSYGNGVVYDVRGSKILNFNQMEGILHKPSTGKPHRWRWNAYQDLEKQRMKELLNSMVNDAKQLASEQMKRGKTPVEKKPEIDQIYENVLAELPHPAEKKSKINSKNLAVVFNPIILKISHEFTLRINGQDNVVLLFSSNRVFYRFDLGVIVDLESLDHIDELAPDRVSDVPCVFDALLHLSPSLQVISAIN